MYALKTAGIGDGNERLQEFGQPRGAIFRKEPGFLARLPAAEKQKKLRALETRGRDLDRSRSKWKERAHRAERTVAEGEPSKHQGGSGAMDHEETVQEGEYLAREEAAPLARGHGDDLSWVEGRLCGSFW